MWYACLFALFLLVPELCPNTSFSAPSSLTTRPVHHAPLQFSCGSSTLPIRIYLFSFADGFLLGIYALLLLHADADLPRPAPSAPSLSNSASPTAPGPWTQPFFSFYLPSTIHDIIHPSIDTTNDLSPLPTFARLFPLILATVHLPRSFSFLFPFPSIYTHDSHRAHTRYDFPSSCFSSDCAWHVAPCAWYTTTAIVFLFYFAFCCTLGCLCLQQWRISAAV